MIDDLIAEYEAKIAMLRKLKARQSTPRWSSVAEMLADLDKLPKTEPTKPLTVEQIDEELDIIRGLKPTPDGYKVRPQRVKELMEMRRRLS